MRTYFLTHSEQECDYAQYEITLFIGSVMALTYNNNKPSIQNRPKFSQGQLLRITRLPVGADSLEKQFIEGVLSPPGVAISTPVCSFGSAMAENNSETLRFSGICVD